jgi:hypothetical protein
MRKRNRIEYMLFSSMVALLLSATLITLWQTASYNEKITDTAFKQLHNGMTLKEVENLLGGPPGDYGPGKGEAIPLGLYCCDDWDREIIKPCDARVNGMVWLGEDVAISACFDKQGRMSQIARRHVNRQDNLLVTLLRRVGLKKQRTLGL